MTTGLTWTTYQTQLAQLAVIPSDDANFQAILPATVTYAENEICRDLDFLQFTTTKTSYSTTPSNNVVTIGADANTPDYVALEEINVITPAGTTDPLLGTITPLVPVSKEWLRWIYPSAASKGTPAYFAPLTQATFLLGPWPDVAYTLQTVGKSRPDSLSASNTQTFISLYLPDLFLMASMIYISGFQRNFSANSDDPAMAVNYRKEYERLLSGATVEEARKKFQASAWSSMSPPAVATPQR